MSIKQGEQVDQTTLRANLLLDGLPQAELDLLTRCGTVVDFTAGEILCRRGEVIDAVLLPLTGTLSLLSPTDEEPGTEVGLIGPDGIVGVTALLMPDAAMPWVVLVQVAGRALRLPSATLRDIAEQAPQFRQRCCHFMELLLFQISQTAACNARHPLAARLARWLLVSLDRLEGDTIPMTHEFLANMLGVRRAGVTVTANELQAAGLVRTTRGRLVVADPVGLEAASCTCFRILRDHEMAVRARMGMRERICVQTAH